MRITPSVDILELLWTAAAFIGLTCTLLVVGGALDEYRVFLLSKRNGALKLLAQRHIIIPSIFAAILTVCFLIGAVYMLDIPTGNQLPAPLAKTLAGAAFFLIELLALAGGVYMYFTRISLLERKTPSGKKIVDIIAEAEHPPERSTQNA